MSGATMGSAGKRVATVAFLRSGGWARKALGFVTALSLASLSEVGFDESVWVQFQRDTLEVGGGYCRGDGIGPPVGGYI